MQPAISRALALLFTVAAVASACQEPGPPSGVVGVILADQGLAHHPGADEAERLGRQETLPPTDRSEACDRVVGLVDQGGQDPAGKPARPGPVRIVIV